MTKVTGIPDNFQVCCGGADAVVRKELGDQLGGRLAFGALDFRVHHIEQSGVKRLIAKGFGAEAV
jgi:hypothetical protein